MSSYLDYIDKKYELGLVPRSNSNVSEEPYNAKVLKTLKEIKSYNAAIKVWLTLIGIIYIIGIIAGLLFILENL